MKGNLKYKILLGVTFLAFILIEILKPQPTDWRITLSPEDKIPFGTYVFNNLIVDLFPNSEVKQNDKSLYQVLREEDPENLIVVTKNFTPSNEDLEILYQSINEGLQCLLVAENASEIVKDTFDLTFNSNFFNNVQVQEKEDSLEVRFNKKFYDIPSSFISSTLSTDNEEEILTRTSDSDIIFLEKKIGKGKLLVCSAPLLITNYTLLSGKNSSLLEGLVTQLPDKNTTWATLYAIGRVEPKTIIRYLLSQPPLKWAYSVGIITLFLFMILRIKREQRKIPTINPPKNTSIEFAETVGQLYLSYGNHKDIVIKKILYLKEYLHSTYLLNVNFENEEINKVANKTGKDVEYISTLYFVIQQLSAAKHVDKNQLISFNKKLEEFYIN